MLLAAGVVFDRVGYNAAKLQEIAQEAGASTGALYAHFKSKAELAEAVMGEHLAQWDTLLEESHTWGLDALHTLARLAMEIAQSYQDDAVARAAVRIRDDYYDQLNGQLPQPFSLWSVRVARLLHEGLADGSVAPGVDCAAAARVIVASFFGVQDMSARLTCRKDILDRMEEWWQFITPVVAADPVKGHKAMQPPPRGRRKSSNVA